MGSFLEAFDRVMDSAEDTIDMLAGKRAANGPQAPTSSSSAPTKAPALQSASTSSSSVTITDMIDGETGAVLYVVRQGKDRCECYSLAFANRIKALLEGSSK